MALAMALAMALLSCASGATSARSTGGSDRSCIGSVFEHGKQVVLSGAAAGTGSLLVRHRRAEFLHIGVRFAGRWAGPWRMAFIDGQGVERDWIDSETVDRHRDEDLWWSVRVPGDRARLLIEGQAEGLVATVEKYAAGGIRADSETVVGASDFELMNDVGAPITEWGAAVARLSLVDADGRGGCYCTGFRVAPAMIATARHCLPRSTEGIVANFGLDGGGPRPDAVVRLSLVPVVEHDQLDFALLEVMDAPKIAGGPVLSLSEAPLHPGSEMVMIQHPAGEVKQVVTRDCHRQTDGSEDGSTFIYHTCDAKGGSSGSPILAPRGGEVLALHTKGFGWSGPELNRAAPLSLVLPEIARQCGRGWRAVIESGLCPGPATGDTR